ncbi:hypothetical protein [uncultured Thiocystis sp.]|jgi:hypothetical protein|uniref:hypothetical protein n=1 Tax=uncultured Thiocystis sp. TaxID=1202134 RepID=UPI0025CBA6CE|nr:hypothetical protein [uncultured Thiocystis sp.]
MKILAISRNDEPAVSSATGCAPSLASARANRDSHPRASHWLASLIALTLIVPFAARAEVRISGFGTLGAAVSDQDFIYQRFIDDGGTLNRDSLIGLQLDAQLADAWGLTLQAKAAPSTHDENAWEPTLSWAFLSWRPDNDLLLRAGRLRLPLMLYSANSDVGVTFEFARLPTEVYSLLPTTDVNGLSFARTWLDDSREWTLEGYLGTTQTYWRYYLRDNMEPLFPAGVSFLGYDFVMGGLTLSRRERENLWRIGLHRTDAEADQGPVPRKFPFVTLVPGTDIGYYQVADAMPGPGVSFVDKYVIYVLTLGMEMALPWDIQLIGEYGQRRVDNAAITGPNTHAAYLSLLKRIGCWTPYVYWAGIRSRPPALNFGDALNRNRVPDVIPGAAAINATQRAGADMLGPFDQQSWAIGTSYSLSPTSKLKAEWMHTRTGVLSSFVDSPAGEDSGGRQINVFSLSYNFTF